MEDAESLRACDAAWREHSEHLSEEYPFGRPFIGRLSLRRACRFRYHSRQPKKSVATPDSLRHELWVRATITDDSKGERRFSSFASTRVNY